MVEGDINNEPLLETGAALFGKVKNRNYRIRIDNIAVICYSKNRRYISTLEKIEIKEVTTMERWMTNFKIVHTEAEAQTMCDEENATGSYYKRKYHRAHYTPWSSRDNTEHGFIVWYVSKTGVCKATPRKSC